VDDSIADVGPGPCALAVDVGGTIVKSALVGAGGSVGRPSRARTPREGDTALAVVEHIAELLDRARRDHPDREIAALGVAVPGIVDEDAGVGVFSENLGWRDRPLRRMLEERVDASVTLVHDVRAAGEAEARIGAGAGHDDVATVAIGTGVAAALWAGGRPIRGRGYAGEIGHLRVTDDDMRCACGGVGCLEAVASAAAIERRYRRLSADENITGAQDVIHRAERGDPVAQRVWNDALDALTAGLAALTAVVAPEVIVLSGGLSLAGDALIDPLSTRLVARVRLVPAPRIVQGRFAADAGTVGAALSTRPRAAGTSPVGGSTS
jgi:glucokinase